MFKRRALINIHTQLENVPKEWLNVIEPHVVRGAFLPCWVWTGAVDRNGYPHMRVERKMVMAHRFVAKIFYDFPDAYFVSLSCGVRNCVNPNHIKITARHPRFI